MSSADRKDKETPPTFEQALARLESIVHRLEEGQLDLSQAMDGYEEGVRLLKQCHEALDCAERKIELLSGVDADGKPIVKPFDDEASLALDQQAKPRNRRRSTPTAKPETAPDDIDGPRGLF